jgi:hypothetical protein
MMTEGSGMSRVFSSFGVDAPQAPVAVEMAHAERGDRLAPHACVAQDQKDRDVARALPALGGRDERVHQLRSGLSLAETPFGRHRD